MLHNVTIVCVAYISEKQTLQEADGKIYPYKLKFVDPLSIMFEDIKYTPITGAI